MTTNRYANGKIYRLVSSVDNEFYIGSTCMPLSKRLYTHKAEAKHEPTPTQKYLNNIGWQNVKIVLIEEFPCENKMQLEQRERKWIEDLNPSLNKNIPTRTQQEYGQLPRVKEYKRLYRVKNRERLIESGKQYYAKNKEIMLGKNKKQREEKKDEYNKNRREKRALVSNKSPPKTKEEIYLSRQEVVKCECGCETTRSNLSRHKKCKKHQQWLQNQPSTSQI